MHRVIDQTSRPRGPRYLLIAIALVAALLLGSGRLLGYYVDALWFGSLGYTGVFSRAVLFDWGLFVVFLVVTWAILFGSFLLLRGQRLRKGTSLMRTVMVNGQPFTADVGRWLRPAVLLLSLLIA